MAAAGLWTTASDLARFAVGVQRAAEGASDPVLSSEMCLQMLSRQKAAWGLGFKVEGNAGSKRFSHGGVDAGFDAQLVAYVATGQGAVVIANSNGSMGLMREVIRSIAREYGWPDYPIDKQREYVSVNSKLLESYVGRYAVTPQFVLTVTRKGDQLHVQAKGQRALRVFPISETEWFLDIVDAQLTFKVNKDGKCNSLVLHQNGRDVPGRRVAE